MAQRRLEILSRRKKKMEKLEWNRDALVKFYAEIVSEALDGLSPEERHHVYMIMRLRVEPAPDGSIDVSGTLTRRNPGFWFPKQHPNDEREHKRPETGRIGLRERRPGTSGAMHRRVGKPVHQPLRLCGAHKGTVQAIGGLEPASLLRFGGVVF
jgi:hypothetical protein